jgi:hypothetical protein
MRNDRQPAAELSRTPAESETHVTTTRSGGQSRPYTTRTHAVPAAIEPGVPRATENGPDAVVVALQQAEWTWSA